MFECLKKHLVYSTNGGNILPLITVFPQRKELNKDFRIWNSIMLTWAGYRQPDGTVFGDPANADFTEVSHRRNEQVEQVKGANVFYQQLSMQRS